MGNLVDTPLEGGFSDPVLDAQACFAKIMNGFARPGTLIELGGKANPPPPVAPAAGAFLAALADFDTPVWLDPAARAGGMADWLGFHTGARTVESLTEARFVLVCEAAALPPLAELAAGTDAYPDRSATLLLTLPSVTEGPLLRLAGPGIETYAETRVAGLPNEFAAQWRDNGRLYPRGIDLLLVAGNRALALPRTTRLLEG